MKQNCFVSVLFHCFISHVRVLLVCIKETILLPPDMFHGLKISNKSVCSLDPMGEVIVLHQTSPGFAGGRKGRRVEERAGQRRKEKEGRSREKISYWHFLFPTLNPAPALHYSNFALQLGDV